MQNTAASRKRTAPGANVTAQQPQNIVYPTVADSNGISGDMYNWAAGGEFGNGGSSFPNTTGLDNNYFTNDVQMQESLQPSGALPLNSDQATFSGQLVRRNRNNQLAVQNRPLDPGAWQEISGDGQNPGWENAEDDEDMEQKAMQARKDAQSKRKTIPPFVMKLSSFLDEDRNTDLIRWSDDGNSFIVLNEDEFAKTLIPELFKHNNYASFVRQLNMYGFHKKVGLSDNSMKSSESKVKNPSEYFNKYFKRGRPELLWLIQKPKNNAAATKRKRDDEKVKGGDSDDEVKKYQPDREVRNPREEILGPNQEMALIPTREINSMRSELRTVQQQQKLISQAITRIRQQNDQLYNQSRAFQTLHDRHENSINAILTFLATFYNRSLETNNGPNLADIFAHAIPQGNQNHGNVVDVGDTYEDNSAKQATPPRRKQPLALLPAPEAREATSTPSNHVSRSSATKSPSVRPVSRQNSIFKPAFQNRSPSGSKTPVIKQDAPTPNLAASVPENDEIMSVIHNTNANQDSNTSQSPQMDLSAALSHFQNADGGALSPQQRSQLLSYMAANSPNAASPTGATTNDNALINPTPPPMPSLDTFSNTQAQLDLLQKMQQEQDEKVQNLAERLHPLSPSGSIPGFIPQNGDGTNFFGNTEPNDLDINSFINSDDYFTGHNEFSNPAGDSNINDFDFNFDNVNGGTDFGVENGLHNDPTNELFSTNGNANAALFGGLQPEPNLNENRVESVSSEAPSPANTTDGNTPAAEDKLASPRKKRKKSG